METQQIYFHNIREQHDFELKKLECFLLMTYCTNEFNRCESTIETE